MFMFFLPYSPQKNLIIQLYVTRDTTIILELAIPAGVPMTVVNEKKEITLSVTDKIRKVLST